jgi:cellulose synthase operon protein C
MIGNRVRNSLRPALCLAVALFALPALAGAGWDDLLRGAPLPETEAALKRDLDTNPADAGAAYGLALIQMARGQREKAVVTAMDGLRNAPGDPLAFLLEDLVGDDASFSRTTTRLVSEALPLLAARDEMDPMVRFNLGWLGYQLAARSSDLAAKRAALANAGFVPGALFSRPEKELSRVAFYETAPVETGALSSMAWKYSQLDSVQCRPPAYDLPDTGEYNLFALAPFDAPDGGDALLYMNAAKSFKVYLDGKLVLVKDVFKRQENPTEVRRLKLNAGKHWILVKLHGGRGQEDGVHIALLDAKGCGLKVAWGDGVPSGAPAGFQDLGAWKGAFWTNFAQTDPRFEGFSALWYRWQGDVAKGRIVMEGAAARAPKCLAWNLWVARMYLTEADDLPPKIAQSRAEKAVEGTLEVDASAPLPLYLKSILQGANSDDDQDLVTLSGLVQRAPDDSRWFVTLAGRFQEKGWISQARSTLELASSSLPECESVESAWIAFYQRIPDPTSQAEAIKRLGALRRAGPELAELYGATQQWDKLHALYEQEAQLYGDRDKTYEEELARVEVRMGRYGDSRKRLEALVALQPSDVELSLALARACFLMGDRNAALDAWTRLKSAKPDAFQVDIARWAMGEPILFQDKHLTLEQVLKEDTSKEPDAAPSSLLLDQMATRVQRDGSSFERYHGIIKINNKEGVDREGEQSLPGQIVLSLRTIKPDGRVLEPEQIPEKETVSMQGLEAGDIIEYEYITLKPPSGVKKDAYVTAQVYLFQDIEKPFHRTQWYLEWPDSIPMQFAEQNLPSPCRKGSGNGLQWRDWDYRDMPRIAPEPDTPNKVLFVPLVEAVGGIDWKDLARFTKDNLLGGYQVTPEVERAYAEAVGDAKTPEEKTDKMVRYLIRELDGERSGGWQDPTQTLLTRQGSRLPVAAAFLTLAGIPFDILVAEIVPDRVYRENLPRIGQFSAPVLRVNIPGHARYLTLGSPYRDPYVLPWYLQGARAIDATAPEPWKEVDIPSDFGPWTAASEDETRELGTDGDLRVVHRQVLDPEASGGLRGSLRKLDKDQWKQAVQMALSKQHGNLDVEDFTVDNLEDPFRPLGWNYTIVVHGYAADEGGRLTVPDPLPAIHLGQALASLRERKLPLSTGGPIFVNQRFTLKVPAGWKLEYQARVKDAKGAIGSYHLKTEVSGDALTVERRLVLPYQIVWPDKYAAFAAFMGGVDDAESGQLAAVKPAAP